LIKHSSVNATTNKTPAELFFKRSLRTKLPCIINSFDDIDDEEVRDRDKRMKSLGKERADKDRRARVSDISVGDFVYVKNFNKENKLDSNFSPELHKVVSRTDSDTIIQSCSTNKTFRRNVVHLKKATDVSQNIQVEEKEDGLVEAQVEVENDEMSDQSGKSLEEEQGKSSLEPIPKLRLKRSGDGWETQESSRPKRSRNLPLKYREENN
jgi:hypothetical protein